MRFSNQLFAMANAFRANKLNSTDVYDHVHRPADWRHEKVIYLPLPGRNYCVISPLRGLFIDAALHISLSSLQQHRTAIGGNYMCVHLRRADFLQGRESTTPSLRAAATQIKTKAKTYDLATVFVSSDCTEQDYRDLKSYLPMLKVVKFSPASEKERIHLKPGGIAIVDQIICSHAR